MTRNAKRVAAAAALAIAVLVSTFLFLKEENREIKNVVTAYNETLGKAYLDLKPSMMQNVTSVREMSRIDNYIAYLLKNNKVLQSEIKELDFRDVMVTGTVARVITKERWVYTYLDPVTRLPVSETYDVYYGNTYTLRKTEGHWVVENIESKEIGGKTEG